VIDGPRAWAKDLITNDANDANFSVWREELHPPLGTIRKIRVIRD
jgi:hypothetical protein